jgi:hypothetical protein
MQFMKAAVPIYSKDKEVTVARMPDIDRLAARAEQPEPKKPAKEKPDQTDGETPAEGISASPAASRGLPQIDSGPRPSSSANTDSETVSICAVSGRLATPYCPKTSLRTFPAGKAPASTCYLHPDPFAEH